MSIVLITALFALILAFILGLALGFFQKIFAVAEDPLKGQVRACLPGANCGACGFPGCDGYAAAVAAGTAEINKCSVGGKAAAAKLAALMGGDATVIPAVAVLACQGSKEHAPPKGDYWGIPTCRGAKLSAGGSKLCSWGCLGFGDCTQVCQFGAISIGAGGLPHIDHDRCTGCKACIAECPQQLLREIPKDRQGAMAVCSNRNPIKQMVKKTCKAGCMKCEACVRNCPEKCITMDRGIPVVDYAKCNSCGTCVAKCPTKGIKLIQQDIISGGTSIKQAVS
ncbi:MAG: RnfABCDGE type electron transport complex subunit B [Treponema sp.]|jgi:Na+-translocating ferredoxin:NAD+ oxidoreductase RNF subunit RnfB|nr:RnfABCDGE type electron transport complex subunit B [Treponema sp.]